MRWRGRQGSSNIEDRRGGRSFGFPGIGGLGGGFGGGFGSGFGGGGCARRGGIFGGGGIGIILLLVYFIFGANPLDLLYQLGGEQTTQQAPGGNYATTKADDELKQFVSVVLAETERVWSDLLLERGIDYPEPTLVLFSGSVESACGYNSSAVGPFYCPADSKVYLDLAFFQELQNKFQALGDFAMAYVVAHEVGHHIQNVLGISEKVQSMRRRMSETEYNKYSVMLELQADYFAGVWAHYTQKENLLEEGDVEEAMNAASAIGDDAIQKRFQGYVVPDSFTHGTSEQRKTWFLRGFRSGRIEDGNTFDSY